MWPYLEIANGVSWLKWRVSVASAEMAISSAKWWRNHASMALAAGGYQLAAALS
jgi:hypothetical protein